MWSIIAESCIDITDSLNGACIHITTISTAEAHLDTPWRIKGERQCYLMARKKSWHLSTATKNVTNMQMRTRNEKGIFVPNLYSYFWALCTGCMGLAYTTFWVQKCKTMNILVSFLANKLQSLFAANLWKFLVVSKTICTRKWGKLNGSNSSNLALYFWRTLFSSYAY
jgi:hypothetical protein